MATKIQIRRDTAANWTSADPTLADGEMGYETDTGYMKIGDGTTAWSSLGYFVTSPDQNTTYTISMVTAGSNTVIRLLDNNGAADDVQVAPGTGISVTNAADIMTVSLNALLNDVSDVSAAAPSTNDLLQWNGAAWANVAPSSAGGFAAIATSGSWTDLSNTPTTLSGYGITDGASTLNDLTDVAATGTSGAILQYNGSQWVAAYSFTNTMEFLSDAIMRKSISYYASDYKFFRSISAGDTIVLRDSAFAGGGAGIFWLEEMAADFVANIDDSDVNANRYLERKIIVNNNYIAPSTPGAIIITGNKSDPSFVTGKEYILRTGDGTTYTYGPTTDGDRNFYTGIAALSIPGLTIGFGADDPTYLNPARITYVPQYEGDTLELVEPTDPATSGWDHLAMVEKVYSIANGDIGGYGSPGVVLTGLQHNGTALDINWIGGAAPTGGTGRYDIYDIFIYYDSSTYGRQCFIKHSTTDALGVQMLKGDLTGSVFAEDSTLLVDALNGTIVNPRITGGVTENNVDMFGATGTVVHDTSTTHIFYHSGLAADFTANFTNVSLNNNEVTSMSLILEQGATAYIPTAVQIDGAAQTLLWQGGSAPTGTANGVDNVTFSLIYNGSSYTVLGQLASYS